MREREYIKNTLICAARQFRHNTDTSPDLFNPEQGFVVAYDKVEVDRLVVRLAEREAQKDARIARLEGFLRDKRLRFKGGMGSPHLPELDALLNESPAQSAAHLKAELVEVLAEYREQARNADGTVTMPVCPSRSTHNRMMDALAKHEQGKSNDP